MNGHFRGISIKVSFWFFATVSVLIYTGVDMLAILCAALIHEVGHLIAVWIYGGGVESIIVHVFGAVINPKFKTLGSHHRDFIVTIAGPLAGGFAAVFFFLIGMNEFALMNLILTCFNLLPLNGLDGGSLVTSLKWLK